MEITIQEVTNSQNDITLAKTYQKMINSSIGYKSLYLLWYEVGIGYLDNAHSDFEHDLFSSV